MVAGRASLVGLTVLIGAAALPLAASEPVQGVESSWASDRDDDWQDEMRRFRNDLRLSVRRSARDARQAAWELRRSLQRARYEWNAEMRAMRDEMRRAARELRRSLLEDERDHRHWRRGGRI